MIVGTVKKSIAAMAPTTVVKGESAPGRIRGLGGSFHPA
jgi:hypothetical protein